MNSIMGPIGPEQLELFALELGKIATFGSKPFENTVGKRKIARNEQFLLFP